VVSHKQTGSAVGCTYKENGAQVVRADLIYTLNGGERLEEWFRAPAELLPGMKIAATLPKGATHYFINLVDSNNFLVSYPEIVTLQDPTKKKYVERALKAGGLKIEN
jgi:hypothetical protein